MLRGMYSSISAMINLQANQSIITNNIANANTNGYKSESLISKSFDEMMLSNSDRYVNGKGNTQNIGGLSLGVKIDETVTNYTQGTFIETDNETDFAIDGDGFFTVTDTQGNRFYTRDGAFKVGSQGYLMTNSGYYVMGYNSNTGNLERINVDDKQVTMDNNGNLLLDNKISYRFNIADFNNYDNLKKIGENLYTGTNSTVKNNYNVVQGYKEGSNVDIIEQSALLMTNLRAYEANQKVVQAMDSTLNKIANEIGSVR